MKVKHYHREYDSYKTERQWALEGFLVAENVEGIELLPSKQSKQPCKYYKPDEVRPATESELQAFFQPEKERRREQARAYRKARLEREQEERERELEEAKWCAVEPYKKKIEELKEKVKSFEQENNDLQQKLLLAKKEKLEQTNQAIETSQREQALLEEALRRSDIYAYCYRAIEDSSIRLSETEWKELENIINDTYDNFTNKLFILHPSITKMELRICLLLKIKIPVSTISQLVCRTQSAVSMSRKQLYKKIFNKEGTPANLDDFIVSF